MTVPRRRSCLSVPGSSQRMIEKAAAMATDEIVLDLEDAVVPAAKADARKRVVAALASTLAERDDVAVRVNGIGTQWCHDDVLALAAAERAPKSIVIPKVDDPADLAFVDRLLSGIEAGRPSPGPRMRVQALIESAPGVQRAAEIARVSTRLDALILGYADLGASLGRSQAAMEDLDGWRPVQEAVLLAARAAGVQAIDGPHLGVAADGPFINAVHRARDIGFDGKWVIHPGQIAITTEAFSASAAELERARAIMHALDRAAQAGNGSVAEHGLMLDEARRRHALQLLARDGSDQ